MRHRVGHFVTALVLTVLPLTVTAQTSPFAGTWAFTVSGDDTGNGTATVDRFGRILGRGHSDIGRTDLSLRGAVTKDGAFSFTGSPAGNTSLESTFAGKADSAAGTASGTWTNPGARMRGIWTAVRTGTEPKAIATGMHCSSRDSGSPPTDWDPVQVTASYVPGRGRVYLTVLKRLQDDDLDNWVMVVHSLGVTGPGAFDIIDKPGQRSMVTYRPPRARNADKQSATGTLNVSRLSAAVPGSGNIAGSFQVKGGPYTVNCTFNLPTLVSRAY